MDLLHNKKEIVMIDNKLEKVKAEIERCIDRCNAKMKSCPVNTQVEAVCLNKISAYKDVLSFIDSLEEEPASKIWHDSNKEQPEYLKAVAIWNPKIMDGEILTRCTQVYSNRIWAYVDDLLSLTHSKVAKTSDQEEPVSDDSVKCTSKIILEGTNFNKSWYAHPELAFMAGAEWQKQHSKCPLDCPAFSDGCKIGMKEAKQQFINKACDWLKNWSYGYLIEKYGETDIDRNELVKDFKKYIED